MWLDWVSSPGPLALESDALPTALRCLASYKDYVTNGDVSRKIQAAILGNDVLLTMTKKRKHW